MSPPRIRLAALAAALLALGACTTTKAPPPPPVTYVPYVAMPTVSPLDTTLVGDQLPPKKFRRSEVDYFGPETPGTIVIDTQEKFLYLVEPGNRARRYGVGVGRQGFGWSGEVRVGSKQEWPRWFPPKEMLERERAKGHDIPDMMEGGPGNPLGARALYLVDADGKDTLYRIHGTIEPKTIGTNASSGCFRLANADILDLYDRVPVGARIVVRSADAAGAPLTAGVTPAGPIVPAGMTVPTAIDPMGPIAHPSTQVPGLL